MHTRPFQTEAAYVLKLGHAFQEGYVDDIYNNCYAFLMATSFKWVTSMHIRPHKLRVIGKIGMKKGTHVENLKY